MDYIDPVKKPQQAQAAGFRRDVTILVDSGLRKEEAKSLTEEEITGALIRSLKTGERNACFVSGSGEHSIDDSGRTGYSLLKEALERNNYKTRDHVADHGRGVRRSRRRRRPRRRLPAGGRQARSAQGLHGAGGGRTALRTTRSPMVDAIKNYVEGGGHALFMLDHAAAASAATRPPPRTPSWWSMLAGLGRHRSTRTWRSTLSGIGSIFGARAGGPARSAVRIARHRARR